MFEMQIPGKMLLDLQICSVSTIIRIEALEHRFLVPAREVHIATASPGAERRMVSAPQDTYGEASSSDLPVGGYPIYRRRTIGLVVRVSCIC
jgi:hypothetical protein